MTDETSTIPVPPPLPPVEQAEPAPAGEPPAPVKLTQEDLSWSLTMTEELAIRNRFGDNIDSLPEADTWHACAFVLKLRAGLSAPDAFAAADAMSTKAARAEFAPEGEVDYVALTEKLQALLDAIEVVRDELTGADLRLVREYFAAACEDLPGWNQARACIFINAVRSGTPAKEAKKAVAALPRSEAAEQVRTLAEEAGKGESA